MLIFNDVFVKSSTNNHTLILKAQFETKLHCSLIYYIVDMNNAVDIIVYVVKFKTVKCIFTKCFCLDSLAGGNSNKHAKI